MAISPNDFLAEKNVSVKFKLSEKYIEQIAELEEYGVTLSDFVKKTIESGELSKLIKAFKKSKEQEESQYVR